MPNVVPNLVCPPRLRQFVKFCLVGGSGMVVDMGVLYLLAVWLGWNLALSKVCAAEAALLNNLIWNEVWTFRATRPGEGTGAGLLLRLWRFHVICGAGIGLAVL
jgi:dolichol-phosphate mannosyltransferase